MAESRPRSPLPRPARSAAPPLRCAPGSPPAPRPPGPLRACVPCLGRWPLAASATHCPSRPEPARSEPCVLADLSHPGQGERSRAHFLSVQALFLKGGGGFSPKFYYEILQIDRKVERTAQRTSVYPPPGCNNTLQHLLPLSGTMCACVSCIV